MDLDKIGIEYSDRGIRVDEYSTFLFDKKQKPVGAAVFSDAAGVCIDVLMIIINRKPDVKDLQNSF